MKSIWNIVFGAVLLFGFVSCENEESTVGGKTGKLVVSITDSPFPIDLIDEATITVSKITIRKTGEDEDSAFITLFEGSEEFNLMELRNGITAKVSEIELPEGAYDHLRLYVDSARMKLVNGDEYGVKVPSGSASGIKIYIDPEVGISGGLTSELILDVNLEQSFVLLGSMNTPAGIKGFIFKPVIRAVNLSFAGRIEGFVEDTAGMVLPSANVWIENDTLVAKSFTDSTGFYSLIGINEGTYSLFATKPGYDTVSYENVEVIRANKTVQDFELTPVP